jgi:hypothetical protein
MPKYQKNTPAEQLEQEAIFKKAHKSYAAIRNNPKEWHAEQEELALWDSTLADGLEEDDQK